MCVMSLLTLVWYTHHGRRQARPCLEVHCDGKQLLKGGADIGKCDASHFWDRVVDRRNCARPGVGWGGVGWFFKAKAVNEVDAERDRATA